MLKDSGIAISMDRTSRCMDNMRLWRSLKYAAVYLNGFSDDFQAQEVISPVGGVLQLPAPSLGLGAFHPCRGLRPWTVGRDPKETLSPHPLLSRFHRNMTMC